MRSETVQEKITENGKEISISFSGDMVRALLDGRKTQMRIPITRVKGIYGGFVTEFQISDTPGYDFAMRDRRRTWNELRKDEILQRCPLGQAGDRLWGRETFCLEHQVSEAGNPPPFDDGRPVKYLYEGELGQGELSNDWKALADSCWLQPHYKATDPTPELCYDDRPSDEPTVKWKPSILMPRWASRILLYITEIRIQRVQEVTEEDARAEGLSSFSKDGTLFKFGIPDKDGFPGTDDHGWAWVEWEKSPVNAFRKIWDSLYSKKGFGWDRNPWVWVISFRKIR